MMNQDGVFKLFLRIIGSVAMLAIIAVVMPYSWMNFIHQWLGMGQLPAEPIVGYLARSTSAFYAMLGCLFWLTSFDLYRYKPILCYLGIVTVIFGVALFVIDLLEGMPHYWSFTEGPINVVLGIVIFMRSYRIGVEPNQ